MASSQIVRAVGGSDPPPSAVKHHDFRIADERARDASATTHAADGSAASVNCIFEIHERSMRRTSARLSFRVHLVREV
jgi:hypothetical protein